MVTLVVATTFLLAFIIFKSSLKNKVSTLNDPILRVHYQISELLIILSILMNSMIVANGLLNVSEGILVAKRSLDDFGGINILSQLYIFFIGPYIYYSYDKGYKRWKPIIVALSGILFLRGIVMAERIAFLEVFIPLFIIINSMGLLKFKVKHLVMVAVLGFSLFIVLELTRQFYVQYVIHGTRDVNLGFALSWTSERFACYYGDTTNKLYYAISNEATQNSTNFLSGIEKIIGRFGIVVSDKPAFQINNITTMLGYSHRDMTNPGGLTLIYLDFGWLSYLFLLLLFLAFYSLYQAFQVRTFLGLCIYPYFCFVIFDLPRYFSLYQTRFIFPFFVFILISCFVYPFLRNQRSNAG